MKIYHYNPFNGVFTGEGVADESPLEPGVFHIPAHATAQAPPIVLSNEIASFLDGEWTTIKIEEPAVPEKTEEQLILEIQSAVASHLDIPAKEKLYDSVHTAALRAGFVGPFQAEGIAFATWMDACWIKCYELLAEVKAGTRPVMTPKEVISELPTLVLP